MKTQLSLLFITTSISLLLFGYITCRNKELIYLLNTDDQEIPFASLINMKGMANPITIGNFNQYGVMRFKRQTTKNFPVYYDWTALKIISVVVKNQKNTIILLQTTSKSPVYHIIVARSGLYSEADKVFEIRTEGSQDEFVCTQMIGSSFENRVHVLCFYKTLKEKWNLEFYTISTNFEQKGSDVLGHINSFEDCFNGYESIYPKDIKMAIHLEYEMIFFYKKIIEKPKNKKYLFSGDANNINKINFVKVEIQLSSSNLILQPKSFFNYNQKICRGRKQLISYISLSKENNDKKSITLSCCTVDSPSSVKCVDVYSRSLLGPEFLQEIVVNSNLAFLIEIHMLEGTLSFQSFMAISLLKDELYSPIVNIVVKLLPKSLEKLSDYTTTEVQRLLNGDFLLIYKKNEKNVFYIYYDSKNEFVLTSDDNEFFKHQSEKDEYFLMHFTKDKISFFDRYTVEELDYLVPTLKPKSSSEVGYLSVSMVSRSVDNWQISFSCKFKISSEEEERNEYINVTSPSTGIEIYNQNSWNRVLFWYEWVAGSGSEVELTCSHSYLECVFTKHKEYEYFAPHINLNLSKEIISIDNNLLILSEGFNYQRIYWLEEKINEKEKKADLLFQRRIEITKKSKIIKWGKLSKADFYVMLYDFHTKGTVLLILQRKFTRRIFFNNECLKREDLEVEKVQYYNYHIYIARKKSFSRYIYNFNEGDLKQEFKYSVTEISNELDYFQGVMLDDERKGQIILVGYKKIEKFNHQKFVLIEKKDLDQDFVTKFKNLRIYTLKESQNLHIPICTIGKQIIFRKHNEVVGYYKIRDKVNKVIYISNQTIKKGKIEEIICYQKEGFIKVTFLSNNKSDQNRHHYFFRTDQVLRADLRLLMNIKEIENNKLFFGFRNRGTTLAAFELSQESKPTVKAKWFYLLHPEFLIKVDSSSNEYKNILKNNKQISINLKIKKFGLNKKEFYLTLDNLDFDSKNKYLKPENFNLEEPITKISQLVDINGHIHNLKLKSEDPSIVPKILTYKNYKSITKRSQMLSPPEFMKIASKELILTMDRNLGDTSIHFISKSTLEANSYDVTSMCLKEIAYIYIDYKKEHLLTIPCLDESSKQLFFVFMRISDNDKKISIVNYFSNESMIKELNSFQMANDDNFLLVYINKEDEFKTFQVFISQNKDGSMNYNLRLINRIKDGKFIFI